MIDMSKGWGIFEDDPTPQTASANAIQSLESVEQDDSDLPQRYLILRIGGQLFGTSLLKVREIIEPIPPKAIPNTMTYFRGVINLRGQIVSVIDLRQKFSITAPKNQASREAYLISDSPSGPLGAIVDEVTNVVELSRTDIDSDVLVQSKLPARFLTGIAKYNEQLVTLIDLELVLGSDELISIRSLRNIAA